MPSFQHFQNQAEQKSNKSKFTNEGFSLSGLLQYAESAQKQSFESLCRLKPLVKTYKDKVEETSQAIIQAESSFQEEAEIPGTYTAALTLVKESFAKHLGALEVLMSVLTQKHEPDSEKAIADLKGSGVQLENALNGLRIPEQIETADPSPSPK